MKAKHPTMTEIPHSSRRAFLRSCAFTATAAVISPCFGASDSSSGMRMGLVTYLWGQHWDLETLIKNCEASGLLGVELRTTHAHGVEPELSKAQREEVKKRFADSSVECLGPGSNENFDSPDPAKLKEAIRHAKDFLQLSHDIGASGVKVKPNSFHKEVPKEKTLEQIGLSLKELAGFAGGLGQEVRLEVHGQCAELPYIRTIMEIADHPRARVCWNSNDQDLLGEGLEANFRMVRPWFGQTAHVRELNIGDYPYPQLMKLMAETHYEGWVLLEARTDPAKPVEAMIEQREVFESLTQSS